MTNEAKAEAQRIIDSLPDDASLADIVYHLYVRERIEQGLADIEAGRTVSHQELMDSLREWLHSAGQ